MSLPAEALLPFIFGNGGGGDSSEVLRQAKQYTDEQVDAALDEAKDYTDNAALNSHVVLGGTTGTVTLGTGWSATEPYSIAVTVSEYTVTAKTMVSILPNAAALIQMRNDGVQTMYITNDNGTLTAYATGNKPSVSMTVPVLFTEVE